jgi:hypothetical protein
MKVSHRTSTCLTLEHQPSQSIRVTEVVMCAIGIGFFIWVLITMATVLPWYATTIGLLCPIFIFYLAQKTTAALVCTLDKKLSLLLLKRKNWFGEKVTKHHLHEIQDVRVKVFQHRDEDGYHETYEIRIILVSGSYLSLNEPSTSFDRRKIEAIVESIRSFLNLNDNSFY